MKHLIIPTDFSLCSLEPVRAAITRFAGEPLTVTLLHLLEPPTDILGGLRIAYRSNQQLAVPRAFSLAVESVSSVYQEQIRRIKVNISYGSAVPVLRNLLQHLGADAVVFDPGMPFEQPSPHSIDPRALLRRAMPHNVVETGVAIHTTSVSTPPARETPARTANDVRLQPALHDATDTLSTLANFSRHAS